MAAQRSAVIAAAFLMLTLAPGSLGCVHLMGESPDSLAAKAGSPWNYGFRGDDWGEGTTKDGAPWVCLTGKTQSPINLPASGKEGVSSLRTKWSYEVATSNGSDIQVFNNGHTIQVQWAPGTLKSTVLVPAAGKKVTDLLTSGAAPTEFKEVPAEPLQFHFHTDSEHAQRGAYFPMEMHIVHKVAQADLPECPESGCLMVTGIFFRLDDEDKDNPALDAIWEAMPEREGVMADMPEGSKLDIAALLPPNSTRQYLQYEGSLTTPPCSEGLLWHLFTTPVTLSVAQLRKYQRAVGLKECSLKTASNGTATAKSLGARLLLQQEEQPAFVRGSYTGFRRATLQTREAVPAMSNRRALKQDAAATKPDDYECKVVSMGFTNRVVQPLNNRTVLAYE